ncbi:hypothetical protein O6H91_19G073800 [Diphasiastrum complanatum]|uniref:Uncharacterized protein n=1 Tax=Diphasiastrum complanatum TaxID=34168 RepID=A0ACC2AXS9_DIPCM|nr:hypothetical protein O6H91_19G073800 [Diphasiastrum complanatum]
MMVSLLVATTADKASIGPALALLARSTSWLPGPSLQNFQSFASGSVRLLQIDGSIVGEDHLDRRWQAETGECVKEIIFFSKHTAASNKPALTVHPIGLPHLKSNEKPLAGGRAGWAAPPCPRLGPWLRLLKEVAVSQKLVPEFEITLEATHHGPEVNTPCMFVEIGSTEEYWGRQDAAEAIATVFWKGLGLDGGPGVGNWTQEESGKKVLLGLGGGHYVPRHMDIGQKEGVWVGHLLPGYSLPMEEYGGIMTTDAKSTPTTNQLDVGHVGGKWKDAIREAVRATKVAFPGGEVVAHLDGKSFKGWQRTAMSSFLAQEHLQIGKAQDFTP